LTSFKEFVKVISSYLSHMLPFLIMFGGGVTLNTCLYSSFQSQTLSVVIGFSLIGKLSKIIMSSNIGGILPPKKWNV
jgi:hypothetical protein